MFQTKRMAGYLFAFLSVLQLAAFFIYRQTTENFDIQWLVYLVYWIRLLAEAVVPLLTAAAMLLLFSGGHRRILLFPILPILSRTLYYLPDHYLYYIEDQLTTMEALSMAAIVSLIECAVFYGLTILIFLIAKAVLLKADKEKRSDFDFESAPIFSLENPFIKSIFFAFFAYFCLQTAIEIVRTVSYLVSNAGTYTAEEILTLILSFVMHFVILLLSHLFAVLYLRYAKKHYIEDSED